MSISPYLVRMVLGAWRAQEMRGEDWGAGLEAMGTKKKFWCQADDGRRYLFKYTRPGTGEDWSEKVAAEIGAALQVPCATVELATYEGHRGTLTQSFTDAERGEVLVHGNELLERNDPEYLPLVHYGASHHTVDAVLHVLDEASVDPPLHREVVVGLTTAADWFLGYLLLDALIGNTDRHHENWGIVEHDGPDGRRASLAPSYDHASSLGRELLDEDRKERLSSNDRRRRIDAYARRARSGLYASTTDKKPLSPLDAFRLAARSLPRAGQEWLERLAKLDDATLDDIVARVPEERASLHAKRFSMVLLRENRRALLEAGETSS